jgi:malonyl-CoA O-methyltransferase
MSHTSPPTLDPVALERFKSLQTTHQSVWLHQEVGERMEQRLQWFKELPTSWMDFEPINTAVAAHKRLQQLLQSERECITEYNSKRLFEAAQELRAPRLLSSVLKYLPRTLRHWLSQQLRLSAAQSFHLSRSLKPTSGSSSSCGPDVFRPVQMIWANMALHLQSEPQALIAHWHESLEVGGWVMFSCLGPDTTREIRDIYKRMGWGHCSHEFTDMHDWGDMLVEAGFSDPVMDMERITLTYSSVDALINELRSLGKNFHTERFQSLRGKAWLREFKSQLSSLSTSTSPHEPCIPITFEIIYGHAFKVAPKIKVASSTTFSESDLRAMLKR